MKYTLKDKKFEAPANALLTAARGKHHTIDFGTPNFGTDMPDLPNAPSYYKVFKDAGVLDIWFKEYNPRPDIVQGKWYKVDWNTTGYCSDVDIFYAEEVKDGEVSCNDNYYRNGKTLGPQIAPVELEFYKEDERFKFSEAKEEEVEEVLRAEAKRRGYIEGAKVTTIGEYKRKHTLSDEELDYDSRYGLFEGGADLSGVIFKDGKWAEIHKELELPTIKGYEGKDNGDTISWGCQSIPKSNFTPKAIRLADMVLRNGVTREEFNKVAKYVLNDKNGSRKTRHN